MSRVNRLSSWGLLLWTAIIAFIVFTVLAAFREDTFLFLSVFIVMPTLLVASVVLLVYAALHRGRLRATAATLGLVWTIALSVFLFDRAHPFQVREAVRWFFWSHEYKDLVLAQPTSTTGDLKHIKWDSSGFAGLANNTVYLVFDPVDGLALVAHDSSSRKAEWCPLWRSFNSPFGKPLVRRSVLHRRGLGLLHLVETASSSGKVPDLC